jgi:hypothetical protein
MLQHETIIHSTTIEPAGRRKNGTRKKILTSAGEREKFNWCGIHMSYKPTQLSLYEGKPRFEVVFSVTTILIVLVSDAKYTASHIRGGNLNGKM